MKSLLQNPLVYTWAQSLLGFANVRCQVFNDYLEFDGPLRILDIGCGPGNVLSYIPHHVHYIGFDTDEVYIRFAQRKFSHRGEFHCKVFDAQSADEFQGADVVMFNGVLHHLDDQEVDSVLQNAHFALKPGGRVLTLDGCYLERQSRIARILLDHDRGKFVRTEQAYRDLMAPVFANHQCMIRQDLGRLPYTYIIMLGQKEGS